MKRKLTRNKNNFFYLKKIKLTSKFKLLILFIFNFQKPRDVCRLSAQLVHLVVVR